jgi:hypothetical protein
MIDGSAAVANLDGPAPMVIRSRLDLEQSETFWRGRDAAPPQALGLIPHGSTYVMAQEVKWVDSSHFAVGRWDGSMAVFRFTASTAQGPVISKAVNSPSFEGVQMISPIHPHRLVTSNDAGSMMTWHAPGGTWEQLERTGALTYPEDMGVANSGTLLAVDGVEYLVAGHANGFLSAWRIEAPGMYAPVAQIDLRHPAPVNPWGLHNIRAVVNAAPYPGRVIAGSEDGLMSVVDFPSSQVLSQSIYNDAAKRGINTMAWLNGALLVGNCSVGADDHNLWLFGMTRSGRLRQWDRRRLVADADRPQVFNFAVVWAQLPPPSIWLASTEEGALWAGTVRGRRIDVAGHSLLRPALGSALACNANGHMVVAGYDLHEYQILPEHPGAGVPAPLK